MPPSHLSSGYLASRDRIPDISMAADRGGALPQCHARDHDAPTDGTIAFGEGGAHRQYSRPVPLGPQCRQHALTSANAQIPNRFRLRVGNNFLHEPTA